MRGISRRTAVAFAGVMFIGISSVPRLEAEAQGQDLPPVSYVASIKPSEGGRGMIRMMPGAMSVSGMPIRLLIRQAYGPLQEGQLVGGPDWIDSERFDIEAKLEGPPNPQAMAAMLRQMLADRFNLKVHTEQRDLPVFELRLARDDGRPGPSLKSSSSECIALMQTGPRGGGAAPDGRGGPPPAPPGEARGRGPGGPGPPALDGPVPCGMRGGGFGILRAGGTTMTQFATALSGAAQRVVLDKTGLTGYYDIHLAYTPSPDQLPQQPPPPGVQLPAIDPAGPSLFTALQEQLGLKLESSRAPVAVVVIDSVDRPTEN